MDIVQQKCDEQLCSAFPAKILRHADVSKKLNISPASLFDMIAKGRFPKPFNIIPGGRSVGWLECDVDAWVVSRREAVKEVL